MYCTMFWKVSVIYFSWFTNHALRYSSPMQLVYHLCVNGIWTRSVIHAVQLTNGIENKWLVLKMCWNKFVLNGLFTGVNEVKASCLQVLLQNIILWRAHRAADDPFPLFRALLRCNRLRLWRPSAEGRSFRLPENSWGEAGQVFFFQKSSGRACLTEIHGTQYNGGKLLPLFIDWTQHRFF